LFSPFAVDEKKAANLSQGWRLGKTRTILHSQSDPELVAAGKAKKEKENRSGTSLKGLKLHGLYGCVLLFH